ncbi:MAG: hypothetical protein HY023_16795 [Chloroflexi bacterium]|nr:hypothetical protein [Chloroflexota bacterium]
MNKSRLAKDQRSSLVRQVARRLEKLDDLGKSITAVEAAAGQAVRTLDPVASRFSQLIDYILDHLPFGLGRSIEEALTALDDLYRSLPALIAEANAQVVNVMGAPFAQDANGLGQRLLRPIRERAFDPAEQLGAQLQTLYDSFVNNLHDPVVGLLDQRAAIRKEIGAFREANQI